MSNIAKDTASTVAATVGCCLLLVNIFGGLVAGIWLLAKGEWRLVVLGFLLTFLMPTGFMIASIPMIGFSAIVFGREDGPTRPAMVAGGFILAIWNAAFISMWCVFIFFLFSGRIQIGTAFPLLLWAYATTMAPLAYMASKEPSDSVGTSLGLLLALAVFVALLIIHLAGGSRSTAMTVVAVITLIEAVLLASLGVAITPPRGMEREEGA